MAKWIYNKEKESHFCEKCGSKAPADPTLIGYDCYIEWLSDYCPQCGEKMEDNKTKNPREGQDFNDYLQEQLKDPEFKKQFENTEIIKEDNDE